MRNDTKPVLENDQKLKFPHVFILNASAGSGKTHNLALRYIQFLLSDIIKNNRLQNILAITFTNKAANEMKERILKLLKEAALAAENENTNYKKTLNDAAKLVNADPKELSDKAGEYVDRIIKNYTDFQIKTIDSFLKTIVSASLLESGMRPGFDMVMDSYPYIRFVLDELMDQIAMVPEIKRLFSEFLRVYLDIENNKSFMPVENIVKLLKTMRSRESINGIEFYDSSIETAYGGRIIYDKLKSAYENIKVLKDTVPDDIYRGICAAIAVPDSDSETNYFLSIEYCKLLKKTVKSVPEDSLIKKQIEKLAEEFININISSRFSSYQKILMKTKERLNELAGINNLTFIDDLNNRVQKLIKTYKVPELYFKLGETIYYYLIDEFQDTDRAQWQNIRELIENSLSNNGSLFYVGDKKQSIYRFKGGDPQLFDEVAEDFRKYHIYEKFLNENRRSSKVLINFFNDTFKPDNLNHPLLESKKNAMEDEINKQIISFINNTYAKQEQILPKERNTTDKDEDYTDGYVHIEYVEAEKVNCDVTAKVKNKKSAAKINKEDAYNMCIEKTIDFIGQEHKRYKYGDMAVLVRRNKDAVDITTGLKEKSIPVESEHTLDIRKHPLIGEVIALLRFLNKPLDNLSFATFISGEIFSKVSSLTVENIYDRLLKTRDDNHSEYLYKAFQKWQSGLWVKYLKDLFNKVGYLPPYDLTCLFLNSFKVWENFGNAEGFLMHLLELMKQREDEGENNLDSFLKYFSDEPPEKNNFLVPFTSKQDAVKVLTAHKAKGLEFPVVIIPFAVLNTSHNSDRTLIVKNEKGINSIYQNKEYMRFLYSVNKESLYIKAYIKEQARKFIDELNAFYVAVTRAKHRLYILIPPNDKNNPFIPLLKMDKDKIKEWGKSGLSVSFSGNKSIEKRGEQERKTAKSFTDWTKHIRGITDKRRASDILDKELKLYEQRGEIIHNILSNVQYIDTDIHTFVAELIKHSDIYAQYEDITGEQEIIDMLEAVLSMDKVKPWFAREQALQVFCEKELVSADGRVKRIDRLVITHEQAVVIDFKTGEPLDSHKRQVRSYMKSIRDIYGDKVVKGYLLYFGIKKVVEII